MAAESRWLVWNGSDSHNLLALLEELLLEPGRASQFLQPNVQVQLGTSTKSSLLFMATRKISSDEFSGSDVSNSAPREV